MAAEAVLGAEVVLAGPRERRGEGGPLARTAAPLSYVIEHAAQDLDMWYARTISRRPLRDGKVVPRIRDTTGVRDLLAKWADDREDGERAERAHEAYLSTSAMWANDGVIFYVVVDDEMLGEMLQHGEVEELSDDL